MRIFQTLESYANRAVPVNQTWYRNLYEPLVDMGHDVILFPPNSRPRESFSQALVDAVRKEHTREPIDLFFAYLTDRMVDPGAIDEVRKLGIPTCNFSCNNAHQFYVVEQISPHFDYNLHSERDTGEKFRAVGANPLWWPMASNPRYFKPYDEARTIPASFLGANYALRGRYVLHLLENGLDVHAYGPAWRYGARTPFRSQVKRGILMARTLTALRPDDQARASAALAAHDFNRRLGARYPGNMHPPVSDDEMIRLYSRSHVSLGFVEVYDRHDPSRPVVRHVHLREFEAPMSGALYCTGYVPELAEFFEPDKDILIYHNEHELLDKVRYYLAHPHQAEVIRRAGHRRALADHTSHRRFQQLLASLGLSK